MLFGYACWGEQGAQTTVDNCAGTQLYIHLT
jgi:hypothetical protein